MKKNFLTFWDYQNQSKGTERILISTNAPQKRKLFDCDLDERHEACGCGQRWLWMPREIKSKSKLWIFWTTKIMMWRKNQWFDLSMGFHVIPVVDKDQDSTCQTFSYGDLRNSLSRWNIINRINCNIVRSVFRCKDQNRQHNHRKCFHNWKGFHWYICRSKVCSYGWQRRMNVEKKIWQEAFF